MEDDTLNNILNLLQNVNNTSTNNTTPFTNNNDIQTLLIKFLLSGGLDQLMNLRKSSTAEKNEPKTASEKPRTIDLTNYQRLD